MWCEWCKVKKTKKPSGRISKGRFCSPECFRKALAAGKVI